MSIDDLFFEHVKYCEHCSKIPITDKHVTHPEFHQGYVYCKNKDDNICPDCGGELQDTGLVLHELATIKHISHGNRQLLEAMIDLKKKDIVEYETKMAQFRAIEQEQQKANQATSASSNQPRCPKCGSTSITAGQRGWSMFTGLLGSGSTVNRCANCGYKWKPRG